MDASLFCRNLFQYERTKSLEVPVGDLVIGGSHSIKVQSMTTTNTNDTEASIEQCIRIIEAGGQLVRLTTQGRTEADNLKNIVDGLRARGYVSPIVADVHFSPGAAEVAALYADKVRINPGNYLGGAKRFDASADNISDSEWQSRIIEKLMPLVRICKQHETSIRIGVNHGSLSDRIMARYGDTAEGMVASCIEFIDAFEKLDFTDIVISIKASNTRIMVQTVRLLSATMRLRGRFYPLHLGVTEAGSDAEGRIKSAAGIGALLIDGLGDTIRVSLTEAPEAEIPVAQQLCDYIAQKQAPLSIPHPSSASYSPYSYARRPSLLVDGQIGGGKTPIIISDATGRKKALISGVEYVFSNDVVTPDAQYISDQPSLYNAYDNCHPLLAPHALDSYSGVAFVRLGFSDLTSSFVQKVKARDNVVLLFQPQTQNPTVEARAFVLQLNELGVEAPVVLWLRYDTSDLAEFQLKSATDTGLLFIDGLIDGLMLSNYSIVQEKVVDTVCEIMQATNVRYTKAAFISCPGCGRTLYDIQSATQQIKARFSHLKGLKIGVMGCVINGIGEMADADYGYVGATHGKISLYRGKTLIKKNLPQESAIEELKALIEEDGLWREP